MSAWVTGVGGIEIDSDTSLHSQGLTLSEGMSLSHVIRTGGLEDTLA